MKEFIRILLVICGTFSVILGVVGMFLPIMPTTPFLLLASICYSRSSKRFYNWLITNRWCGKYIRNYREGRGVSLMHKIFSIAMLWLTTGYSVWFVISLWWVRLILLAIVIGVTIHLVMIRTFQSEAKNPPVLREGDSSEEIV